MAFRNILLTACAAGAIASVSAHAGTPPETVHLQLYGRPAAQSTATPTMQYYGGPVISAVKVEIVFWTKSVPAATQSGMPRFLAALAASTFTDKLAQYATNVTAVNGNPGTGQTIGRGTLLGTVTIVPANASSSLTDHAIRAELQHQITIGKLPQQDPNTLYMIYFPSGYTITAYHASSCVQFGAYHSASPGKVGVPNLFYGVMPDCGSGFGGLTIATSHEFAEALTDAIPTPGAHPAFPQAWNDVHGSEVGDLCEGRNAKLVTATTTYAVQEVFDASTNACETGNYSSP